MRTKPSYIHINFLCFALLISSHHIISLYFALFVYSSPTSHPYIKMCYNSILHLVTLMSNDSLSIRLIHQVAQGSQPANWQVIKRLIYLKTLTSSLFAISPGFIRSFLFNTRRTGSLSLRLPTPSSKTSSI